MASQYPQPRGEQTPGKPDPQGAETRAEPRRTPQEGRIPASPAPAATVAAMHRVFPDWAAI